MRHSPLTRLRWRCLVLDEGHKIKNERTDTHEAVLRVPCVHKLLLTGTPLQNNLHELWVLLHFLFPDVFTASAPFDDCFDLTRSKVDEAMLDRAHHLLRLFCLRRLKSEVELALPPKHELKIAVPLSEFQLHLYKALLLRDGDLLRSASARASGAAAADAGDPA